VRLLVVDPETGATTTILTENDPAWVNLDDSTPKWLPDGSGLLWMSERTGSRSLELHDPNGAFTRRLTPDGFTFGNVVYIAPDGESLIITGSDNPTENHVFDVDLNGGEMAQLTQDSGHHGYVVAKNGGLRVHSYATRDAESGYEVLNARGDKIGALRSVAEKPAVKPNVEFTTVGEPDYHAVVIRPRDFNPRERYPVIVYVYGGPHHLVVRADPYAYIRQQWIADQGFIVVTLDNRGTPGRGRTWERSVKGDLIKLPLEDQIAGLNALAKKYPELDTSRVGIYGWSFGGYFAANAVMRATQVYHAAVAGAPVADWRDYDTHYTERYMGLPEENPEGYDAASALTHARTLRRPLMLIHGTADDNVYFLHSLKISSELYAAGIPHDFLPLTNFTHMVPDPDITIRQYERIVRFFQSHLCDRMTQ
jgi:dipeptidyl-peptidase-4